MVESRIIDEIVTGVIRRLIDRTISSIIAGMRARVEVNGRVLVQEDPATQTLINDILSEVYASTPGGYVGRLDSMYLVDSNGNLRDYADLSPGTDVTYNDSAKQTSVVKAITASASYTATAVSLGYGHPEQGYKEYFRTSIPSTTLAAGDALQVNWSVTINPSPSMTGILSGATRYDDNNRKLLYFLAGGRGAGDYLTPVRIQYIDQDGTTVLLEVNLNRDPNAKVASHAATKFTRGGNLKYINLVSPLPANLVRYILSSAVPMTTNDSIAYSYQERWS